jgi:multiple sugar transport system substrate-binding protein
MLRLASVAAVLLLAALVAGGCGGGADDANASGEAVIHWTTDRDPTGEVFKLIDDCNAEHEGKWRIEPVIMPPAVDAKREQIIRRLAAQDDGLDILSMDVVWTAEFSETGWIVDMTDRLKGKEADFIPSSIETVRYDGKLWAYPMGTNVALLFYRTDLVKTPPKTWEELVRVARQQQAKHPGMKGFIYQGQPYEGLTVDALEFITAAGGEALSKDGTKAMFAKGDATKFAFTFMRQLIEDGVSPRETVTFMEEESRQSFQNGDAVFLRNWPYVYPLANDKGSSKVAGKFDVAPLPSFDGRRSGGVLGGANLAISAFSKHPEQSWEAIECLAGPAAQKRRAITRGEMPTLDALYDDPEIRKAIPYLGTARTALDSAIPRPVTPYYNDLTREIYFISNKVVAGRISPEAAVKELQESAQLAVDGTPRI